MPQTREEKLAKKKETYRKDPEKMRERHRKWIRENPERAKELRNKSYRKTFYSKRYIETIRKHTLKTKYGISPEDYDELHTKQKGLCAICGQKEKGRRLAVDHCHTSGSIRGLLCMACNTAIGRFKDNVFIMKKAIEYLEK